MTTLMLGSDDLSKLTSAVMTSGMAVSIVDVGIISTAIEAGAMAKEIAGAAKKYPNNSVIQALFSDDAMKKAQTEGYLKVEAKPEEMTPEKAVDTAIARIAEALIVLEGKASAEEIGEYKQFIYSCAARVANAAGSGLFGSGSPKVSDKEAVALAKIKAALGL
ncbi:hypothetical protein [Fischerella sp. PCC 9605]|uniref:hypothetical protein n=1 Tax=Fischerella sp. PCC 9605 TaxID=1173024 RepID=UPI00047D743C|nr:hypothetical protein [Fischerella sp. PCC 9605]